MPYAIVNGGAAHVATGGTVDGVTTGDINSTGANLLLMPVAWYVLGSAIAVSDNKGNSWNPLTGYTDSTEPKIQIYYSIPTSVGAGHHGIVSGTGIYPSAGFIALSGSHASAPFDTGKENGASGLGPAGEPGSSGTPSVDNCLMFAAIALQGGQIAALALDSPFTILDQVAYLAANHEMIAFGYEIQTTKTARNPSYTTVSGGWASTVAVFKPTGPDVDLSRELHEPTIGSSVF